MSLDIVAHMPDIANSDAGATTMLDSALELAALGLHLIPMHQATDDGCSCGNPDCTSPGKHPRTKHGWKSASRSEKDIRTWWTKWPEANIGVVTGPTSRIVVIDVDPRNGGDRSFDNLQKELGSLPACPTSLTGGGGMHLWFAYPFPRPLADPLKSTVLAPGLDLLSQGKVSIEPPSLHYSGRRYAWMPGLSPTEVVPPELPEAWFKYIVGKLPTKQVADGSHAYEHSKPKAGMPLASDDEREMFHDCLEWLSETPLPVSGSVMLCCPAHDDHTASLHADLDRAVWHCFGCGEGSKFGKYAGDLAGLMDLVRDHRIVPKLRAEKQARADRLAAHRRHGLLPENMFPGTERREQITRGLTAMMQAEAAPGGNNPWLAARETDAIDRVRATIEAALESHARCGTKALFREYDGKTHGRAYAPIIGAGCRDYACPRCAPHNIANEKDGLGKWKQGLAELYPNDADVIVVRFTAPGATLQDLRCGLRRLGRKQDAATFLHARLGVIVPVDHGPDLALYVIGLRSNLALVPNLNQLWAEALMGEGTVEIIEPWTEALLSDYHSLTPGSTGNLTGPSRERFDGCLAYQLAVELRVRAEYALPLAVAIGVVSPEDGLRMRADQIENRYNWIAHLPGFRSSCRNTPPIRQELQHDEPGICPVCGGSDCDCNPTGKPPLIWRRLRRDVQAGVLKELANGVLVLAEEASRLVFVAQAEQEEAAVRLASVRQRAAD